MIETFAFVGEDEFGAYVARQLEAAGFERVEEVSDADAVFTFCPYASALEDAYFDEEGLVKRAPKGTLLVDLSPSTPAFARELSAVAAVSDLRFVEAPVAAQDPLAGVPLGMPFESPRGLMCFAAGEEGDIAAALPALEALVEQVVEVGGAGAGQLAKAQHTITLAAQIVASVEREELGRATRRSALSATAVAGAESGGRGESDTASAWGEDGEGSGRGAGISVGIFMADVVAAMAAADDVDLILPHLEAAMHLLELMAVIGGAELGASSLSLLYRTEEEGAACGLDWTRAEGLFEGRLHEGYDHDHDYDHDHEYDDFGFPGGFGNYSAN